MVPSGPPTPRAQFGPGIGLPRPSMAGAPQTQQLEAVQNIEQQFASPSGQHQQQQQLLGRMGNTTGIIAQIKLEPQTGASEQNGVGQVKMEPQQLQTSRGIDPVKMEPQYSNQSMFLQQQQQLFQLSKQNPQAAAVARTNFLQQQQHQILNATPQQNMQMQQQVIAQVKPNTYEPGTCARRLTQYMYQQQQKPEDNNVEFWRKFVAEFFAPNAKKRCCVSLYGSGRQTTGVFPQDVWHCEICNRKPGRGFETTFEVLPRLCQIKYASGTLEELLYVDMPREHQNASGQIVLDYAKAIQESVYKQLRVVRDGHLRIVFNSDLKIFSWEFCARHHEELIPRRLLVSQISQLGAGVQKCQAATQNASSGLSAQDLQSNCNSLVTSARQLAKALEVPLVNDLGYTKRYVRCLQISEVVNSMKDLIDYSREKGTGPIDSLINFPRRTSAFSETPAQQAQHDGQQSMSQNASQHDPSSGHATMQFSAASSSVVDVNNPYNAASATPTITAAGLHQNSMNTRQENQTSDANSPYGVRNTPQIPSSGSSSSLVVPHPNPSAPFSSPTLSSSNHPIPNSNTTTHLNSIFPAASLFSLQQSTSRSHDCGPNDSPSSVQRILQELMSSQLNGAGGLGNQNKGINGITPGTNGSNCLASRNGMATTSSGLEIHGIGFGSVSGSDPSGMVNGIRGTVTNNAVVINARVSMNPSQDITGMSHQKQQDMRNRLLGGIGAANSFSNLQFDWKPS